MIFSDVLRRSSKLVQDNSPAILTGIGVVGTISVAYLSGKASFKAAELIEREKHRREMEVPLEMAKGELDAKDKIKLVWIEYIPAVSVGATTITAIIMANRIGTRRAAAMAAAYTISERAFTEYKDKVIEKFGENKERDVRDEVAQDRVRREGPKTSEVLIVGAGEQLFMDKISGRYFESTVQDVKKAMNDTNYEILHNSYCSLGDFYNRLGLAGTKYSEEIGWKSDHPLEIIFSTTLTDDDRACIVMDYATEPVRGYNIFG